MGWDEIERNWNELKGEVKRQWSKLNDEDVELVKGKLPNCSASFRSVMVTRRSRPSGKSMIGLSGSKVDSAAELAALRNDVASLSASVGDLVRRQAAVGRHPLDGGEGDVFWGTKPDAGPAGRRLILRRDVR